MSKGTLSSKGQVTIPVVYRRRWKLSGSRALDFNQLPDGTVQIKPARSIMELAGILKSKRQGPAPSIRELRKAAERAWAERNNPNKRR